MVYDYVSLVNEGFFLIIVIVPFLTLLAAVDMNTESQDGYRNNHELILSHGHIIITCF
jgi:hypothetical protein